MAHMVANARRARDRMGRFRKGKRRTTRKRSGKRKKRRNTSLMTMGANPRGKARRAVRRARGLLPFSLMEAAGATAGAVGTRLITDMVLKAKNRGPLGYAANVAVTLALSMLARKVMPKMAAPLAYGGIAFTGARIVGELIFKRAGIAGVVDLGSSFGGVEVGEIGLGQTTFMEDEDGADMGELTIIEEVEDPGDVVDLGEVGDLGSQWQPWAA